MPVPGRRFFFFRVLPLTFVVALAAILLLPVFASAQTRKVAVGAADSGTCLSTPCGSFAYAYRQATPGDVVEVGGGTYGGQNIPALGRGTPSIEIRPAAGAAVTLTGSLDINADNVVVRDFKASDLNVDNGDDVLENVTTVGIDAVSAYFQNTKNLVVKGGRLGGLNNKTPVYVGSEPVSYNVTFDGVDFHDATVDDSETHTECLMVNDVQGMVIKNSLFRNCGYFGLMISHLFADVAGPTNVTLENNVFEHTKQWNGQNAPYSMLIGPVNAPNFVFRNNTFETPPTFNNTTFSGNSRFVGNLGALTSCPKNVTFSKNVWTAVSCGSTDKKNAGAASQFVNPAAHDFHLKAGAAAIDAGDKNDYPATDRDGYGRPVGAAPDAGAHEYGAGPSTPSGGGANPGTGTGGGSTGGGSTGGGSTGGGSTGGGSTGGGSTGEDPATHETVLGTILEGVDALVPITVGSTRATTASSEASLRSARLGAKTLCLKAKGSCKTATRLTLRTVKKAKVRMQLRYVGAGKTKLVRNVKTTAKSGTVVLRLTSKHLKKGAYRLDVKVVSPGGRTAGATIRLSVK